MQQKGSGSKLKAAEEELKTYLQPGICNELELRLWRRLHVAKLFKLNRDDK